NPVKTLLAGGMIELEDVLRGLRSRIDRRARPQSPPIASWNENRFIRITAEMWAQRVVFPELMKLISGEPVERAEPSEPLCTGKRIHDARWSGWGAFRQWRNAAHARPDGSVSFTRTQPLPDPGPIPF